MNEFEERSDFGLPILDERFSILVAAGELDGGDDEGRERPSNAITSFCELFARRLEKLRRASQSSTSVNETASQAHPELDLQIICLEEMHHPCDPSLLLGHLLDVVSLLSSSASSHLSRSDSALTDLRSQTPILLIPDEHMAQLKYALDIFGRFDDRLVLENGGDNGVADSTTGRVWLSGQQSLIRG